MGHFLASVVTNLSKYAILLNTIKRAILVMFINFILKIVRGMLLKSSISCAEIDLVKPRLTKTR